MKKYVKPELFYESFALSQNIAACGWDLNWGNPNICMAHSDSDLKGFDVSSDLAIFATEMACGTATSVDQYCYMPGTSTDEFNKVLQS